MNEIVARYKAGQGIVSIAQDMKRTRQWVKRALVRSGAIEYHHPKEDTIRKLHKRGLRPSLIAKELGMGVATVCLVLPPKKKEPMEETR